MKSKPEEIVALLREEIAGYDTRVRRDEVGAVLEVGDGIATVYGLDKAVYGELVELETGVKGMVMNLARPGGHGGAPHRAGGRRPRRGGHDRPRGGRSGQSH